MICVFSQKCPRSVWKRSGSIPHLFWTSSDLDGTKIANNTEDVWPFKKRTSRTAFSGKQPHTDVKIPLLNGILAEAIKTRKAVQAQRPDPQLTLDFEPLAVSEVPSQVCLSCVYVSGYVSLHLSMRQRKTARRHLFVHTGCMCCHLPC